MSKSAFPFADKHLFVYILLINLNKYRPIRFIFKFYKLFCEYLTELSSITSYSVLSYCFLEWKYKEN